MQDLDEHSVTTAALAQMDGTPDPRLRTVMASLVRHLHDFARDVELTPDEWLKAIGALTQVGQACAPTRQEFILLSDVLGLSALVNLLHDRTAPGIGTESSLLGPFYQQSAPEFRLGDSIATRPGGTEIQVYGRVVDGAGQPVPHASLQVWQTDAGGSYDMQRDHGEMDMRGNFRTGSDGRFHFRSVMPQHYMVPMDGPVGALVRAQGRHGQRPAHIHFLIGADGYRELVTALYIADDAYIGSDTVFGVSRALAVLPRADDPNAPFPGLPTIAYDFRLAPRSADDGGRVGADPAQIMAPD